MQRSSYSERDYAFGQAMVRLRGRIGLTQAELAEVLGISRKAVSHWEVGESYPKASHLQTLLAYAMEQQAFAPGQEEEEIRTLWQVAHQKMPLAEHWLQKLLSRRSSSPTNLPGELFPGTGQDRAFPAEALWTVPYMRNPHFTGRSELIEQLMQQLAPPLLGQPTAIRRAALTQVQVIKGLGGIGKTQIAIEYAYRAHEQGHYTHILWIAAGSLESILASFVALAGLLPGVAPNPESDQRKLVSAVIRWLEQCREPWLLIMDNADDLSLVQPYLPLQGNGSVLFTTRASAAGGLASSIEVDAMGVLEGAELLLRRAQRFAGATGEEINEAINLVVALAHFPLALDQAGAYIEETGCRLSDYLQLYQTHRYALLSRRGRQATGYPDSVATTWSLSFAHIAQTNPAAAELLHLCAYLSPDHIPEELLTGGAPYWPPALQQAVADTFRFNQVLETLLAFSLVTRLSEQRLLSIHRLVQAVQMERMEPEEQHQWAERVVRAVNSVFPHDPENEVDTWQECQRYLEQAQASDTLIEQYRLLLPEAADVLDRAGLYLRERAIDSLAEPLLRRALAIREQLPGDEHPDVAVSLVHLASLCMRQGRYAEAEPLLRRALAIREQLPGDEHPDVAASLNGLAILFTAQGKYMEAESLYQRAIAIGEKTVGPMHTDLAASLNGLATLFSRQGRYGEAEQLLLQALHMREQFLGPGHLSIALSLQELATLYVEQGKHAEAEPLFLRGLDIYETYLGDAHPDVAILLHTLAALYWRQGKHTEAEPLFRRALGVWEKYVGPKHSQMAFPLLGLAGIASATGNHEEAERLAQQALDIWEEQLGPEHPDLAFGLWGLALISVQQGRASQAEALFARALSLRERHLGEMHVQTAQVLHDFASFQYRQGRDREAAVLYQRALTTRERILGPENPLALDTRTRLLEVLDQKLESAPTEGEGGSHLPP